MCEVFSSVLGVEAVLSQTWLVNEFTCYGSTAPAATSFRGGVDRGQPVRQQLAAERRGGIFAETNANREEVCFLAARVRNGVFAAAIQKNDRAAGATS
jgi:hypothetical protein